MGVLLAPFSRLPRGRSACTESLTGLSLQPPSNPLRPECCKPWELCAGPASALVASMAHPLGDHERDREALLARSPSPLPQLPTQAPHGAGLLAARGQRRAGGDLTQNQNSTPCCWSSSLPRAASPAPPVLVPAPSLHVSSQVPGASHLRQSLTSPQC